MNKNPVALDSGLARKCIKDTTDLDIDLANMQGVVLLVLTQVYEIVWKNGNGDYLQFMGDIPISVFSTAVAEALCQI